MYREAANKTPASRDDLGEVVVRFGEPNWGAGLARRAIRLRRAQATDRPLSIALNSPEPT